MPVYQFLFGRYSPPPPFYTEEATSSKHQEVAANSEIGCGYAHERRSTEEATKRYWDRETKNEKKNT